jgi:chaperonin GroES
MAKLEFSQRLMDDLVAVALLDKSEGRVLLPDWQRVLRGEVVAVGPGRMLPLGERAPMECKVGDVVTFAATAGMDADYGVGKKVRLMRDTDVDCAEIKLRIRSVPTEMAEYP